MTACFAIVVSDLHPVHSSNDLLKCADDMYLIVSASDSNIVSMELDHIADWASTNNLCLNNGKTHEFVVFKSKRQNANSLAPPPINGINQVQTIKILGVTVCNDLSITTHIDNTLTNCAQSLFTSNTLRSHGMQSQIRCL